MSTDRRKLTRMIAKLVAADPGAQARIATMLGEKESTVAHWFSNDAERLYRMPVDALPVVVDALDKPEIYGAIIAENNLDQPQPKARPTSNPTTLSTCMLDVQSAIGRACQELADAGTDVDDDEGERIYAQAVRARAALDAFIARTPRREAP